MTAASKSAPCLTPVLAGLLHATPGQICRTLKDEQGNSDFDTRHCRVLDTTAEKSVPVANDSLAVKRWCFTLAAGKRYSVQIVITQIPGATSRADLAACGSSLMTIDSTNQIQTWTVQS